MTGLTSTEHRAIRGIYGAFCRTVTIEISVLSLCQSSPRSFIDRSPPTNTYLEQHRRQAIRPLSEVEVAMAYSQHVDLAGLKVG